MDDLEALEDEILAEAEDRASRVEAAGSRQGWLKKRQTGPELFEDWQTVWVVLKGSSISWAEGPDRANSGDISLATDTVILSGRKGLEIVSGNTTLLLLADTEAGLNDWKAAIETVAGATAALVCDASLVGR